MKLHIYVVPQSTNVLLRPNLIYMCVYSTKKLAKNESSRIM